MLFLYGILRNGVSAVLRRVHTYPNRVHFFDFAVLTFGKLRAILRRNHAAAIVNCSFQQRIPRIIAVLCLHIQNQTNQAILARCGGIKTDIIANCTFGQRHIFRVRAMDRGRYTSVGFVGIHADSTNLRFTLDILFRNLPHRTAAIFRNAFLHNNGQNAFVGKQTLNAFIVAGIRVHLGYALRQIIFFLLHGISAPFPCLYYTLFLYFLQ